jgi:hypothetical protein
MPEPNLRLVVTGGPRADKEIEDLDRERSKAQKELRIFILDLEKENQDLRRFRG